jgi:two-component system NtrC family response regulator
MAHLHTQTILLVDDDRNFLHVLNYHIQEFGFQTIPVSSGAEALECLKARRVDLVVTDLKMPAMDGLELLAEIRKIAANLPVIVLTAHGSIDKAVEAVKGGACDFLTKPFEKEEIQLAIDTALKMSSLVEENRRLAQAVRTTFEFGGFVGSSKKFHEVLEFAEQLAGVDTTVLIQGESGTGKELLARAIHFNSPRRGKPFVVVNCGAIPKELMESELFGYKRGAFTGAVTNKKGKFEVADEGTLLLDEVGDLPLGMQVKLLRVLQEKELDVLGDPIPHPLDVRIMAATNQDLAVLMGKGIFRDDLFYRISVAPLHLPPLRERREDIPLLVYHFLEKLKHRFGKEVRFEQGILDAFQSYSWPGNVRELENVVERLMVFDRRGVITEEDLPTQFRRPVRALGSVVVQLPEEGFRLQEIERDILQAALERHRWNQTRSAQYLGITRNTLIYRMQKYNLREPGKRGEGAT